MTIYIDIDLDDKTVDDIERLIKKVFKDFTEWSYSYLEKVLMIKVPFPEVEAIKELVKTMGGKLKSVEFEELENVG